MKSRPALAVSLGLMALLIACAIIAPHAFMRVLLRPELYLHAKFVHVLAVTMFFANVVIGTLWETRALVSQRAEVIRYTYETVAWLDAVFTAPLILLSVLSGLMLAAVRGGLLSMGWLILAFGLFLLSGLVWVSLDIPSQYRVKRMFAAVPAGSATLPPELMGALRFRLRLNLLAILPLLVVFGLMVHKPELPAVQRLFTQGGQGHAAPPPR